MVFKHLTQQLSSLISLLSKLNEAQYEAKIAHLGNASIGAHTRHIIELLKCAINGYKTGIVDYINRERNLDLEVNISLAIEELQAFFTTASLDDKPLKILFEDEQLDEYYQNVSTTYYREIIYNIEHIIHHLALIKVALVDMDLCITEEDFGIAYSTIKYKKALSCS